MTNLIIEAIQYLCVAWYIMFGLHLHIICISAAVFGRRFVYDATDLINGFSIFFLLAAGLPSLKLIN